MFAMLYTVILVCALRFVHGIDVARCSNRTDWNLTLTPYDDGIVGRYGVKLCSVVDRQATHWALRLAYYDTDKICNHPPSITEVQLPGNTHSLYEEAITFEGNCTHVCLNTTFDLVYTACYSVQSLFLVKNHTRQLKYTYFNVKNNYTSEFFMNNSVLFEVVNYDSLNEKIIFHTGVPFSSYSVKICKILNITTEEEEDDSRCVVLPASACSAPSSIEVACRTRLTDGYWSLRLALYAGWAHGALAKQANILHTYHKQTPEPPVAGVVTSALATWLAAGGASLLLAAVSVATLLRRSWLKRLMRRQVRAKWLERAVPAPAPTPVHCHVVLLYAREGPVGARLVEALVSLLEEIPGVQVHDLFSPGTIAAAAPAPSAWLTALCQRPDTAILALQTPALAALYQTPASSDGVALSSPLLGRRVVARAPHFGDTLLQYAVRLAQETSDGDYRKYYVATVSGAETEIFPRLVPYRRYLLPAAGAALAHDMCGAAAAEPALQRLAIAARELADRARCPGYLLDELAPL